MSHALPRPGAPMPTLRLQLLDGGDVDFATLGGWRLLVVYRGRHCPLCAKYLAKLEHLRARFTGLGVSVFAVSSDPEDRARAQCAEAHWSFRVAHSLSPADMRRIGLFVSAADESKDADRPFAEPGLFLLDPDGTLRAIDISNAPFSRPDLEGILDGISQVQKERPPVHGTA